MILHWQIRTGSDQWFSKIWRIRTGSDSILSDQDWTWTEKFHSLLISAGNGQRSLCKAALWPFAQISDDFYYLGIWQCARYFVATLFKELALPVEKCEVSYYRVSVSNFRSRSQRLWQSLGVEVWWSMVNGLLFHMTQPTSRSIMKAIACSKPIVSEH